MKQSRAHVAQAGAVHKMIVVVLVVVVLLGVAAAWWVSQQSVVTPLQTASKKHMTAEPDRQHKEACAPYETLCFTYPKDWQLTTKEVDINGIPADAMLVQSPGREMQLVINTGITGIGGGPCEPGELGKVTVWQSKATTIKSIKPVETSDYLDTVAATAFVEQDVQSGRFVPRVMLTMSKVMSTKGEHDGCHLRFASLIGGRGVKSASGEYSMTMFASGKSQWPIDSQIEPATFATVQEAIEQLDTTVYQQAFEILASAHYN